MTATRPPLRLLPILCLRAGLALALLGGSAPASASAESPQDGFDDRLFRPLDVFELEWASDPRISPDGSRIVYVRSSFDVMSDRRRSELWVVGFEGGSHRPLVVAGDPSSPRWSPDGTRLAYLARSEDGPAQVHLRWMDSGQTARLTRLTEDPGNLVWSPDGRWLAFTLRVPERPKPFVEPPLKPEGAEWAPAPRVIDRLIYRADGQGYLEDGYEQLFVLPAEGGTPRQLTSGPWNHGGTPAWTPDGEALLISANRRPDAEHEPRDSEIWEVSREGRSLRALTDRRGPDTEPAVSPDGRHVAYLGFDDRYQGYQLTRLYLMERDGGEPTLLTGGLDRSVENPSWSPDGRFVYVQYDDRGNTEVARVSLAGEVETLTGDVGGTSLGRPYAGGSFSVGAGGRFAFTETRPDHPAEVAVGAPGSAARRLTGLNDDLLAHKELGRVEELWWESSHDGRKIQGWLVKPPGFEAGKRYPLILEIHGGPFANYGDRFSAEVQLYAAAGYAVLYANPRGSTGYGEEFGNLIHHNYPGEDYNDLMSGVDAAIARGIADPDNLFVTGGSGGGVLTSWIVGKTGRFRAAVVAKPVIHWTSFALTADLYNFFWKYWFPGPPWEHPEHYWKRSPLSLVGHVTTPTMLLTGEADYRTPIGESEQFYQALKLRGIDTALVRVPEASHGIAARPSHLIAKVAHVLAWFERYRGALAASGPTGEPGLSELP